MIRPNLLSGALCSLWAGTILGGSLIAAPAKFTVSELALADLLRVGRAQFHWLGTAEVAFGLLVMLAGLLAPKRCWPVYLLPIVLLGLQRVLVLPALQVQTDGILAGGDAGPHMLHALYAALDAAKITVLVGMSLVLPARAAAPERARADV